jgi:hypothetical protein
MTLKPFSFSLEQYSKPIYLYSDILNYHKLTFSNTQEMDEEIYYKWINNTEIIILDDRNMVISKDFDYENEFDLKYQDELKKIENNILNV